MSKPKVLHIESGMHLYGGVDQVLKLLEILKGKPVENLLLCRAGSEVATAARSSGVAVEEIPPSSALSIPALFAIRKVIRRWKPDIIQVHSDRGADVWAVLAAKMGQVSLVITRRIENAESRTLDRWRYGKCQHIVAISEHIATVLKSEGVADDKIVTIHDGVDTSQWRPTSGNGYLREQFGIQDGEAVVAMAVQFTAPEGHAALVKAIPAVLARHPNTRFLLPGKGPLWEVVRASLAQFGDRIILPGFRNDLERIIPECTVLAHLSHIDDAGSAPICAAACGVPVVAGRIGGIPEVVLDGDTGYLVDPLDYEGLAARINEVIENQSLRELMGESARAFAEAELSIEVMAEKSYRLYLDILSEAALR